MTNFGRIGDALSAGQRAEARIDMGPIVSTGASFANLSFSPSDFATASFFDAINRQKDFIWGLDKWGDETYKVGE